MWVVQAGRMKLDELHIVHSTTRPPSGGNAVPGSCIRIGGVQVHLASAPRGQHRVGRAHRDDLVAFFIQGVQAQASVWLRVAGVEFFGGDQVHQGVVLEQVDIGALTHLSHQGALNRRTSCICHVHDAALAVPALARQMKLVRRAYFQREFHTQGPEPGDGTGCVFHNEAGGVGVTQTGARYQGVCHMLVKGITLGQHRRNSTLRPAAGAIAQ